MRNAVNTRRSILMLALALGGLFACDGVGRGDVLLEADIDRCPLVTSLSVLPAEVKLGGEVLVAAHVLPTDAAVEWSGPGIFSERGGESYFRCTAPGEHILRAETASNRPNCVPTTATAEVVCTQLGCDGAQGCAEPDDASTCSAPGDGGLLDASHCGDGALSSP